MADTTPDAEVLLNYGSLGVPGGPAKLGDDGRLDLDQLPEGLGEGGGTGTVRSVNTKTGDEDGNVTLSKGDVGLGNAENTSDETKPLSKAARDALALKANAKDPQFSGTPSGITKAHVGLGSVDNTSDETKPLSKAARDALALKANAIDTKVALARVRAGFAKRASRPVTFVSAGGGTAAGNNASSASAQWIAKLSAAMQSAYTLPGGAASPAVSTLAAASAPLPVGVQWLNNGRAGAKVTDYLTPSEITKLGTLATDSSLLVVQHLIGGEDWATGVPVANFQTQLLAVLGSVKSALGTKPLVQVIVAGFGRLPSTVPAAVAPWSDYVKAMRELAEMEPENRVFIDMATPFAEAGLPSTASISYDPFDLLDTDDKALNDAGHDLLADLLRTAYNVPLVLAATASAPAMSNTASPAITGGTSTGSVLTLTDGTWTPSGASYSRQWRRDGVAISGQTGSTYTLTSADVGRSISAAVTATLSGYTTGTATSNTIVGTAGTMANTEAPTISASGTTVGATLTADPGTWSNNPASYTYQWRRQGGAISGATASTYTTTASDEGVQITVAVTPVRSGYSGTAAISAPVVVTAASQWQVRTSDSFTGPAGTMRDTSSDAALGGVSMSYSTLPQGGFARSGDGFLVKGAAPGSTNNLVQDAGTTDQRAEVIIQSVDVGSVCIDLRKSGATASDPCIRLNCTRALGQLIIQTRGTGAVTYLTVSNIDWSVQHKVVGEVKGTTLKVWLDDVPQHPDGGWTANNPTTGNYQAITRTSADAEHRVASWVLLVP